ncbi:hypothetical protein OCS_01792 [Ophiocordyceps sinensis CO18]|uniref:Uncharacterized protein n=1 Tax=Ophiocordyceps sinensis (strain Co18 / CGMCC 3.14243) TaxID=911162 RepID=T5AL55_OPHSC|nr:hypothetical protein OCS_01792 [Ophiocordyceps sinensis CO18]
MHFFWVSIPNPGDPRISSTSQTTRQATRSVGNGTEYTEKEQGQPIGGFSVEDFHRAAHAYTAAKGDYVLQLPNLASGLEAPGGVGGSQSSGGCRASGSPHIPAASNATEVVLPCARAGGGTCSRTWRRSSWRRGRRSCCGYGRRSSPSQ